MKIIIYTLLSFLLVSQIYFGQVFQQNREANPNIKNSLLDHQDKHFPIIDGDIQAKTFNKFIASKIPDKFRIGNKNLDVNGALYPFIEDRFFPNGHKTFPFTNKMLSPQSQIYVIDTALVMSEYYNTVRHLYSFNSNAKKISDLFQILIDGLWVDKERQTSTYDANNNLLTDWFEYRENGQWISSSRDTYTYDGNNNMLSFLYEEGGYTIYRYTYSYDSNNNMLSSLWEFWENGQWVNWSHHTYTYDVSNNMLSSLTESWQNGQWLIKSRFTYTYDLNNNMLSSLHEYWDYGQWSNNDRYTYTYDANENMLSALWEYWDNGQWWNIARYTYTYDSNNNMLSSLKEDCNNSLWVCSIVETYTYDENNNNISFMDERYSGGQLEFTHKYLYTYDEQNNMISVEHYALLDSSWVPKDVHIGRGWKPFNLYDTDGNNYFFNQMWYKISFIRKLIVTEVESKSDELPVSYSLSQNFPNPFNPTTTIGYVLKEKSSTNLILLNTIGEEIAVLVNEEQDKGFHKVYFNAANLPSGVYFYRLQAGDFVQTRKMILLK